MSISYTDRSNNVLSDLDQKMKKFNEIVGGMAEGYAKALAPADTGNLRDSITHDHENNYRTVVIGTNVQYAPYQELGAPNAHVPPHPYLRPAIENHVDEYMDVLRKIVGGV
jgi:phage gpG-like protein